MEMTIRDEQAGEDQCVEDHCFAEKKPSVPPVLAEEEQTERPVTAKKKRKKRHRMNACLTLCKYDVVWDTAKKLGWNTVEEDDKDGWHLFWTDMSVSTERAMRMNHFQRINHFPGMSEIARKSHLARNLNRLAKVLPKEFKFYPKTWVLPADIGDLRKQGADKKVKTYIVKPSKGCQGNGIYLTRNVDDINMDADLVVQRYLHKPLLIDGLKFDLRIYVLVTSVEPLRIYLYKEGMGRFCTEEYTSIKGSNLSDQCMHLTNYAINRKSENYEFNEGVEASDEGSKRSMSSVMDWVEDQGYDVEALRRGIEGIVVKTCLTVQPLLAHTYNTCFHGANYGASCFEILGFDVMIDHKLQPWLIEVNHTPSFSCDTPFDEALKSGVINSAAKMVSYTVEEMRRIREYVATTGLGARKKATDPAEKPNLRDFKEKMQKLRVDYEEANQGEFELIYPSQHEKQAAEYDLVLDQAAMLFGNRTRVGRSAASSASKTAREKPKTAGASSSAKEKEKRPVAPAEGEATSADGPRLPPSARLLSHTVSVAAKKTDRVPSRLSSCSDFDGAPIYSMDPCIAPSSHKGEAAAPQVSSAALPTAGGRQAQIRRGSGNHSQHHASYPAAGTAVDLGGFQVPSGVLLDQNITAMMRQAADERPASSFGAVHHPVVRQHAAQEYVDDAPVAHAPVRTRMRPLEKEREQQLCSLPKVTPAPLGGIPDVMVARGTSVREQSRRAVKVLQPTRLNFP